MSRAHAGTPPEMFMSPTRRDFLLSSAAVTLGAAAGSPRLARAFQQGQPPAQGQGQAQGQVQAQPVFTPIRRDVGTQYLVVIEFVGKGDQASAGRKR